MLAKPTKGVSEILNKFQGMEFTCEYKYDGERAQVSEWTVWKMWFSAPIHILTMNGFALFMQIHYMEDGSVEIYSRNAERNTGKFPDVVLTVAR